MFTFLKELFKSEKEREYDYLSSSISLVDLERRMKEIERGLASYQKLSNYRLV